MLKPVLAVSLAYLLFNILCGSGCALIYLIREKRVTTWREFIVVAMLPCIGLGLWAHARDRRRGIEPHASLACKVLTRMGLLNILFVAIVGAAVSGYAVLFVHSMYIEATTPSDPTSADMAEMLAGAIFIPIAALIGGSVVLGAIGLVLFLGGCLVGLPLLAAFFLRMMQGVVAARQKL